ncbi:DegT/DnrJ/EryC1/StrS family aminotransferase [Candidatus Woesearchaeota archaeon]|nr:DegT/DnrJ/EryC1/StrS family aminotransferase [Candidatus Woesearchaeota archaeon]
MEVNIEPKRKIELGTLQLSQKAKQLVNEVLDSNRLSYGRFSREFEQKFSKIHQCKYGILSNSGTSALHVALAALKEIHNWNDDDEVLVPSITFVATSNIVIHNRMTPVFVDIEKEYYGIDPALIEQKITKRTRAIIVVHLFGMPCAMDAIHAIAKEHNLKIIEDSCETMFARYKDKSVGNLSDIACFSTYIAHLLTTGVGGINTTNNLEYAIKLRSLVNHGRDSIYFSIDDDDNKSADELKEIIAKRFSFVSVGHSFRVTEMEAALGVAQLDAWNDMIAKRRYNGKYLMQKLSHLSRFMQLPKLREGAEHSFMMFPLVLHNEQKQEFVNYLENHGIETRDLMPLINQPIYQKLFNIKYADYPIADWINKNGFYIPCHQDLTQEDLDYIVAVFDNYFNNV